MDERRLSRPVMANVMRFEVTMKLYKFRAFEQLEYILDIVLNERLRCSEYNKLNDPFEGVFHSILPTPIWFTAGSSVNQPLVKRTEPSSVDELYLKLEKTRVCSLSADVSSAQLWSLYAGGHTGVAIEIDFTNSECELHEVEYEEKLPAFHNTLLGAGGYEKILRTKTLPWKYETEYRLIEKTEWYPVQGRVSRVIAGYRISEDRYHLLRQILPEHVALTKASLDYHAARVRA